jgi:hypothetical protein
MSINTDHFKEIWAKAKPDEKREIFDLVWDEVEKNCLAVNKIPPCPYTKIIAMYHEILPGLPRVLIVSETRKRHMKARWRTYPGISLWCQYFQKVGKSAFLTGQAPTHNGARPFVADIDWLLNEQNMVKVIEGKYER